jgi:hypothetical protein
MVYYLQAEKGKQRDGQLNFARNKNINWVKIIEVHV